tara:strand:+ start:189 stop:1526 length:1338 start_codon:yes stop_codon:yes gene_type:complete
MGLGFFRAGLIAGGSAADIIRVADKGRDDKFNEAMNDFVDNNVPRFMEARQKRTSIKTKLTQDLQTLVSKYIQPDKIGLDQNSGYELAEKLLFDNGGKIENVDAKYKAEQANYTGTDKYNSQLFIKGYFNSPKSNQDSRTLDQIVSSRAMQISPDPTIDITGKAEALAGYKDSALFKMDRNSVRERLIAATGYTDPVPISQNVYSESYVSPESADPMRKLNLTSKEQSIESNEFTIDEQRLNKAIGKFSPGKINDIFNDNLQISFQTNNIKGNWDSVTQKWKDVRGKGTEIVKSMQDSFQSTVKGVIDSGDFNIKDFVPSTDGTTLILKEKAGDRFGQPSKKYILPDLKSIANGIIGENLPTTTEGAPIISIDEGTLNGGVPTGNIVKAPDPNYRKGDVSKYEIGRIYVDANGKKFMFLKNTQKQVGNRIVTVVDMKSRFYFDPR